jgi:hypothetical protein
LHPVSGGVFERLALSFVQDLEGPRLPKKLEPCGWMPFSGLRHAGEEQRLRRRRSGRNNQLVTRLQDGALVYVTVGDAPIEQYL